MKREKKKRFLPEETYSLGFDLKLILITLISICIIWVSSFIEEGSFPDNIKDIIVELTGTAIISFMGILLLNSYRKMNYLIINYTKQLKELVITDSLTELYNQRYFYERLNEEIIKAGRQRYPLYLVFIDADRFKEFNDKYGHIEGDRILRLISMTLKENIRKFVDSAFRYGGDEFAIILVNVDEKNVVEIVNRFTKALEGVVRLSIGIARFKDGWTISDFIRAADDAMYRAKGKGGGFCIF